MPNRRIHPDRILTPTERVRRSRRATAAELRALRQEARVMRALLLDIAETHPDATTAARIMVTLDDPLHEISP